MSNINGQTSLFGVIGNPIAHTVSPFFQNIFFKAMGINSVYLPFHIAEDNSLREAVTGLFASGVRGLNVTIPFKESVASLMYSVDRSAAIIGAVNTIKCQNGKLYGANTDPDGFECDFKACTGAEMKGANVLVLGAGGSARSVVYKFAVSGAKSIYILNRSIDRAENLASHINNETGGKTLIKALGKIDKWMNMDGGIPEFIINTTPVGMYSGHEKKQDNDQMPLNGLWPGFVRGQTAYDLVYRPSTTYFLQSALKEGCKAYNGLGMLIRQGAFSFKIWTGIELPESLIVNTLEELKVKLNA